MSGQSYERFETEGQDNGSRPVEATAEHVGRKAREAADRVRSDLAEGANEQKSVLASMINDLAEAMGSASQQLGERGQGSAARYTDAMGSGLADFSRTIEDKSLGDIVGDVSAIARRHPAAFVGGALLAGMALSRMAKASGISVGDTLSETIKAATSDEPATEHPNEAFK